MDGSAEGHQGTDLGTVAAEISRSIVQLHASHYGRGPTKAKTFLRPEFALCVLEGVFTLAERTLIEHGHSDQVLTTRSAFQDAVSDQFVALVEETTKRKVRACISQAHAATDVAIELFLFED